MTFYNQLRTKETGSPSIRQTAQTNDKFAVQASLETLILSRTLKRFVLFVIFCFPLIASQMIRHFHNLLYFSLIIPNNKQNKMNRISFTYHITYVCKTKWVVVVVVVVVVVLVIRPIRAVFQH